MTRCAEVPERTWSPEQQEVLDESQRKLCVPDANDLKSTRRQLYVAGGPGTGKANVVTQSDSSLVSHVYQQSITVFAQYGFWFGFFFLFAAGLSYYLLRPQPNPVIHYVLSDKIPSSTTLSFNNNEDEA